MGFFYPDQAATDAARKPRKAEPIPRGRALTCRDCPLDKAVLNHPKMPPTGAEKPLFYFLGKAPGGNEDEEGRQFVGSSGKMIRDTLPVKWEKLIRWNNTLRCHPPKSQDPAPLEIACCSRLQLEDINRTKPWAIIAFGNSPLHWCIGDNSLKISDWRGRRVIVRIGDHVCWLYPIMHPSDFMQERNQEKRAISTRSMELDIKKVFSDYEKDPTPAIAEDPKNYRKNIDTESWKKAAQLKKALDRIAKYPEIAIDIETNGLRPYRKNAKILTCAVGTYDDVVVFPIDHPDLNHLNYGMAPNLSKVLLKSFLLRSGMKWAHKRKFELEWLVWEFGPEIMFETKWGCTLAQAHVLDGRAGKWNADKAAAGKGLDDLTQIYFGFMLKGLSNIDVKHLEIEPLDKVLEYNGLDTKYTFPIAQIQKELITEEKLEDAYTFIDQVVPSLVMMQNIGVERNVPEINRLHKKLGDETELIKKSIMDNADVKRLLATGTKFSPTSNPNLANFFWHFLKIPHPMKHGQGSVDEKVLGMIKHPVAKLVLEMRSVAKMNSTYVKPLLDGGHLVHEDGKIHGQFGNTNTSTSRLQSEDPNLQNQPAREHPEIRAVVQSPKGKWMVAADYKQLEVCTTANCSGDATLIQKIANGEDIHLYWMERLGKRFCPERLETKESRKLWRNDIKMHWTFRLLFGDADPKAVAAKLGINHYEIARYIDEFWKTYPGVKGWQGHEISFYAKHGYVETMGGFRRRRPMKRDELVNMPIQGTAAHIVTATQTRLTDLAYKMDEWDLQAALNVHDDLSFNIADEKLDDLIPIIAKEMCRPAYNFMNVPLTVEMTIGRAWYPREELGTFTTKDFDYE